MKERKLYHPWWVHLPAIVAWVAGSAILLAGRPWPEKVPMHFDFHGH